MTGWEAHGTSWGDARVEVGKFSSLDVSGEIGAEFWIPDREPHGSF
jgi:hypothetical protein